MHKHIIKAEKPIETKIGQKQYISFSFELLHDVSYTECNESSFFINLLQRLKKLCLLDWNEINKSQRHSLPEAKNLGFRLSRIYENKKSKI